MITAMPTRGTNTTASSYLKNKDIDAEWNKAKAESKKLTNEEREISENDQPVPVDKTLDAKVPDLQKKAIPGTALDDVKEKENKVKTEFREERDKQFKIDYPDIF